MPKAKSQGSDIYYHKLARAEAETVFILAGTGLSGDYYLDLAQALSAQFQVIVMDHRGCGKSKNSPVPLNLSVKYICEDIAAILGAEKIGQAHIIGESYGGMLALGMGIYFPSLTSSLTIVSSTIANFEVLRLHPAAIVRVLTAPVSDEHMLTNTLVNIFSPKALANPNSPTILKWKEIYADNPIGHKIAAKQLVAASKFFVKKDLKSLTIPTLVIYGEADNMVPVRNSAIIHELIDGSKIEEISGGGHHLCFEEVANVANMVKHFIGELTQHG